MYAQIILFLPLLSVSEIPHFSRDDAKNFPRKIEIGANFRLSRAREDKSPRFLLFSAHTHVEIFSPLKFNFAERDEKTKFANI